MLCASLYQCYSMTIQWKPESIRIACQTNDFTGMARTRYHTSTYVRSCWSEIHIALRCRTLRTCLLDTSSVRTYSFTLSLIFFSCRCGFILGTYYIGALILIWRFCLKDYQKVIYFDYTYNSGGRKLILESRDPVCST